MPDVNPFDQVYKQPQQSSAPVSSSAPSSSGPNPFDAYKASSQSAPQSDGHGTVYHMVDKFLNTRVENTPEYQNVRPSGLTGEAFDAASSLNPVESAQGFAKGVLNTAAGLGSIYNKVTGSQQPFNQENLKGLTEAHGAGQSLGKGMEQTAEYALPESKISLAGKAGLAAKMGVSGAVSAAQSGGDKTATALGVALPAFMSSPAAKYAGKAVAKALGMTTAAGDASIARAFNNPDSSGLVKVMRGDWNVEDVVNHIQDSVTSFRDAAQQNYRQQLQQIKTQNIPNWNLKVLGFFSSLDNKLNNEIEHNFSGIKTGGTGRKTTFDLHQLPKGVQDQVTELKALISDWGSHPNDLTPAGLDRLKQNIGEFADNPGPMKALATRLYDHVAQRLNSIIPGYESMTGEYAQSQDLLRKVQNELSVKANGSTNPGVVTRKIQNLFNQNNNYREILMKKLPNGQDLLDQIAGLHLNDVMPKGLLRRFLGFETIMGGYHLGLGAVHPAGIPMLAAASPRVIGETARAAGKLASTNLPIADTARRGLLAGINSQRSGEESQASQ